MRLRHHLVAFDAARVGFSNSVPHALPCVEPGRHFPQKWGRRSARDSGNFRANPNTSPDVECSSCYVHWARGRRLVGIQVFVVSLMDDSPKRNDGRRVTNQSYLHGIRLQREHARCSAGTSKSLYFAQSFTVGDGQATATAIQVRSRVVARRGDAHAQNGSDET